MNKELIEELKVASTLAEAFPNENLRKVIFHLTNAIKAIDGKIEIKLKKVDEKVKIPRKAYPTDACFDLVATSVEYDTTNRCYIYGTGIALEIPEGYKAHIYPRSSNRKTDCYMANHVGVIDCHYRGEIMVSFKDVNTESVVCEANAPYKVGNKIAQICFEKVIEVEFKEVNELSETDRGEGGHGSTGE